MHRRPVDNVDSRVRSQTYGCKKIARRFQPCEVSSFQDPNWSTGELGSSCVISVAQPTRSSARRTLVLKTVFPSRDCFDLRVAAGILPKSSDERKRGEAFPQLRSVSQTKQSHLTWFVIKQRRIRSAAMMKFERVPSAAPLTAIDIAPQCRLADGRRESATAVICVPSCIQGFAGLWGLLKAVLVSLAAGV